MHTAQQQQQNNLLMIAIPHTGMVRTEWALAFKDLQLPPGYLYATRGFQGQPIAETRSIAASYALKSNCSHLLFIDSDIQMPGDALIRLIQVRKPIVGAAYSTRAPPYELCSNVGGKQLSMENLKHQGTIDVDNVGFGFVLIDCRVFDRMAKLLPEEIIWTCPRIHVGKFPNTFGVAPYTYDQVKKANFTCTVEGCGGNLIGDFFKYQLLGNKALSAGPESEDYYFCRLARQCGFPVSLFTGLFVDHELNVKITQQGITNNLEPSINV